MRQGKRSRGKEKETAQWQYDAFISYRHSDLDSFVAETLHRQLENFKLPRSVVRQKMEERNRLHESTQDNRVKTRIHRVFRDKEELPLAANLADPITDALQNSEYLIVICSPRLQESMWCRKEIETFIEMHDREHVLAVLAEGEPDVSFPEELLYREEMEIQPDGSVIKKKIPVEPLAADVRGENDRDVRKKIKSELLRLVAPMFSCNYDDLKQRHKERRTRRIIMTSMSVSAVCLLFGLVSTTMALKIQRQNVQISQQNRQIAEDSRKIAEQYKRSLQDACIAQAGEIRRLLENGDRMEALKECILSYRTLEEEGVTGYPAQFYRALSDSLYLYENGTKIRPERVLESSSTISYMKLSPEGNYIMTMETPGVLRVYNPADERRYSPENERKNKYCCEVKDASGFYYYENATAFLSEERILYPSEGELVCFGLKEAEVIRTYPYEEYMGVIAIPEKESFFLIEEEECRLIDASGNGEVLASVQWSDVSQGMYAPSYFTCAQMVTETGDIIAAVELAPDLPDAGYWENQHAKQIAVLKYDGRELTSAVYDMGDTYIEDLCLKEEPYRDGRPVLYVTSNWEEEEDTKGLKAGITGRLQAIDLKSQEELWRYDKTEGWLYDICCADKEDGRYLVCGGYSEALLFDRTDGTYITDFTFGSELITLSGYAGKEDFLAFTRDGTWHYLNTAWMESMVGQVFTDCTSSNVKDFVIGNGYCVTLPYNSNSMTVYKTARGPGVELFYEGEDGYREAALNGDGSLLAVSDYGYGSYVSVKMFDAESREMLWTYQKERSYYMAMAFYNDDAGEERLLLVTEEEILYLHPADGTVERSVPLDGKEYVAGGAGVGYLMLRDDDALYAWDAAKGEMAYEMHPEALKEDSLVAVCDNQEYYVVLSPEEEQFLFYRMGNDEVFMPQDAYIDIVDYVSEIFFGDNDKWMYIVYKDKTIDAYCIEWNEMDVYFMTGFGYAGYGEMEEIMSNHTADRSERYGFLYGGGDGYQTDRRVLAWNDNIMAHIRGFLAYDDNKKVIYLQDGANIYTTPVYSIEEMMHFASETLRNTKWENESEFAGSYLHY